MWIAVRPDVLNTVLYRRLPRNSIAQMVLENNEIPVYEMIRHFLHTASEHIMPHHI
jgi:hypothetical protein